MIITAADDWSPADNPYAIAVSEARWWRDAALLAIPRMRGSDDSRLGWFNSLREISVAGWNRSCGLHQVCGGSRQALGGYRPAVATDGCAASRTDGASHSPSYGDHGGGLGAGGSGGIPPG